jgi:hypothetical protein
VEEGLLNWEHKMQNAECKLQNADCKMQSGRPILHSAICILQFAFSFLCCPVLAPCAQPGGWTDTRTLGPFICWSDFPLGEVQPLLDELGQLQADLTETLGVPPAAERIHIYLLHGKATYNQFLTRNFPKVDHRRALYVKEDGPGMVLAHRNPDLAVDLRHECTHALLHAVLPVVPLWLDEGLAKYFEAPRAKRAFGHPYLSSVQWSVRLAGVASVEDLERKSGLSEMGNSEYRSAWAWVHFLLHGSPQGRAELIGYLADLRLGKATTSFSSRLRERIPAAEWCLATHFKTWKPRADTGYRPEVGRGRTGDGTGLTGLLFWQ